MSYGIREITQLFGKSPEGHSSVAWAILARARIGEIYLVGVDDEQQSNVGVLRAILRCMGRPEDSFDRVVDRPGHDRRYAIDSTKLRRELGWRPAHTDLDAGLKQTIRWYREHESWWRPAKAATEVKYVKKGR